MLPGFQTFRETVQDTTIVAMTDNTLVVIYIRNQGGTRSRILTGMMRELLNWSQRDRVILSARHIPGLLNMRADELSRAAQLLPSEWSLNPLVSDHLWRVWSHPLIDLFVTRDDHRLSLFFFSSMKDDRAARSDALSQRWDNLLLYGYPPFSLMSSVLKKLQVLER